MIFVRYPHLTDEDGGLALVNGVAGVCHLSPEPVLFVPWWVLHLTSTFITEGFCGPSGGLSSNRTNT